VHQVKGFVRCTNSGAVEFSSAGPGIAFSYFQIVETIFGDLNGYQAAMVFERSPFRRVKDT
jgi:hypothetical protein